MSDAAGFEPLRGGAAAIEAVESPLTPESAGKLGMWLFLSADAVTFGMALSAYGALRIASNNWPVPSAILSIPLTAVMTFVLLASSITMAEAVAAARHGDRTYLGGFLALTVLGGLVFLGLQAFEWTHLIAAAHVSIKTSLFGATFFILTGFHGCHVLAGVIYLSVLLVRALAGRLAAAQAGTVEIASLYWHFIDLVWILLFTFVYLI